MGTLLPVHFLWIFLYHTTHSCKKQPAAGKNVIFPITADGTPSFFCQPSRRQRAGGIAHPSGASVSLIFQSHQLIHPALVTPSLKIVGKEGLQNLPGQLESYHAGAHGQHVGIIVPTVISALQGSPHRAQRIPLTLLAVIEIPIPVVQMTTPFSH